MCRSLLAFAVGAAFLTLSCSSTSKEPARPAEPPPPILQGEHAFALNLYARLKTGEENLFFSPFSISTALAMTCAGARGNTAAQMAEACGFSLPPERLHPAFAALIADLTSKERKAGTYYEFLVANALWGQQGFGFRKEFLDLIEKHYGGGLRQVDFARPEAARRTINRWVEEQTRERVNDLVPRGTLGGPTVLVLTNTIYFKNKWADRFEQKLTKNEPFTLLGGRKVSVPMMHRRQEVHCKYSEGADVQAIELAYQGGHVAMVIFLPKKTDGLPTFEKSLTGDRLTKSLSEMSAQEVVVILPRFTITRGLRLDETLKSLGMTDGFDERTADFTGMRAEGGIWIDAVMHQAFVDTNEEGTEAAAGTAVEMWTGTGKGDEQPPVFRADHPFLFLIRDTKSGTILFMGRVMNPKE